jgi:hypothetical protein
MSRLSGEREFLMKNDLANDPSHERYVVEIDGITKSEYSVFAKSTDGELAAQARVSEQHCRVA